MLLVRDVPLRTTALEQSGKEAGVLQTESHTEIQVHCWVDHLSPVQESPSSILDSKTDSGCFFPTTHLVGKMFILKKSRFLYFPLWSLPVLPGG